VPRLPRLPRLFRDRLLRCCPAVRLILAAQ
jgi:hypothetical protein